jgi:hypothetical protein
MSKSQQMLDLAAACQRRAKTPTNLMTSAEFLLAAEALMAQAGEPQSPLEEQAFKTAEILESDERLDRDYRSFLGRQLRAALSDTRPDRTSHLTTPQESGDAK